MCPSTPEESQAMQDVPYVNTVRALAYLAIATCPDIAHAVEVLAQFSKNPGMAHLKAVKHLFRYLKSSLDYELTYSPLQQTSATSASSVKSTLSADDIFTTFSDADHDKHPDNGCSTSGFVVKMRTGTISQASCLQTMMALSTTEAEYISAVSAAQEIIWLQNLLTELGYPMTTSLTLHINN